MGTPRSETDRERLQEKRLGKGVTKRGHGNLVNFVTGGIAEENNKGGREDRG